MKLQKLHSSKTLDFHSSLTETEIELSLMGTTISADFPSPADDYIEQKLDLNKELISHPSSAFGKHVKEISIIDSGIHAGDTIVIDKSLDPKTNSVLICFLNGDFTVKRVQKVDNETGYLVPYNKKMAQSKFQKKTI